MSEGRLCPRCQGVGVTALDALLCGFGNIVGWLLGQPITPRCCICHGTGRLPGITDQAFEAMLRDAALFPRDVIPGHPEITPLLLDPARLRVALNRL